MAKRFAGPWGGDVVVRKPAQVHYWHTDIESSDVDGGYVSAWIGLENTSRDSTIQMVSGSHLFGKTIQEFYAEAGQHRTESRAEQALALAHRIMPSAELIQPACCDGDVLLFDGWLWHGSRRRHGVCGQRRTPVAAALGDGTQDSRIGAHQVRSAKVQGAQRAFKTQDHARPLVIFASAIGLS